MSIGVFRGRGMVSIVAMVVLGALEPATMARVLAQEEQAPAADKPAAEAPPPLPSDPAALAVLETNPTTPSEKLRAILLLMKLGESAAAGPLVNDLSQSGLDDDAWSELVNQFGEAAWMKIALDKALAPAGKQLADTALGGAERVARDPARLAQFVADLSNPSAAARKTAVAGLRRSGAAAVPALLAALDDPARQAEHGSVRAAIELLGPVGHEALVAALASPDEALTAQIAEVAGASGASGALPRLLLAALSDDAGPAYRAAAIAAIGRLSGNIPSSRAAADYIYRQALISYDAEQPLVTDAEGLALVWWWDRNAGQVVLQRWQPAVARAVRSAELARLALALDPTRLDARWLYWAARLEADAFQTGIDNPLPTGPDTARDAVAALNSAERSELLADCLARRRTVAAAALCGLLGASGQTALLHSGGSQPAPLVRAAGDDDRRLRFAALGAIVQLGPVEPFAGSSVVPRGIDYFISALGSRGAVVAMRRVDEASRLAGLLAQAGFAPQIATERRGLFRLASQMADCELVLIDVGLAPPGAADVLAELRRDPRTARLPVALVAEPEHEQRAHDIARHDKLAVVWIRPMDRAGLEPQLLALEQQAAAAGVSGMSADLRMRQASAALGWLGQLLGAGSRIYDLRGITRSIERALHVTELSTEGAKVLAELPSPQAQRALVELASLENSALVARQAAAAAFAGSVGRYGCLLTTVEIQRQYDRYNDSEFKALATQQLLGSVLDTIEAGRAPVVARGQ